MALSRLIESDKWGVYHATNAGHCSWYEFACEIFGWRICREGDSDSRCRVSAEGTATRLQRMDCSKLQGVLGDPQPTWQDAWPDMSVNGSTKPAGLIEA